MKETFTLCYAVSMDFIHLLNDCPVTYVYSTWYREWCWEVYTPWGEILTLSDRDIAYEARRQAVLAHKATVAHVTQSLEAAILL